MAVERTPYDINYVTGDKRLLLLIKALLLFNGQLLDSFILPVESYPRATYCVRIKLEERKKQSFELMTGLILRPVLKPDIEQNV